jgi:hypothetical protein
MNIKITYLLFTFFLSSLFIINAQEAAPEKNSNIQINKENREVQIEGNFNITKGIIEFIAASNKTPRDYESLFLLNAKPSEVQTALKEIGLTPCQIKDGKKIDCNAITLAVTWKSNNIQFTKNITDFIELNQPDKSLPDLQWLFTGREPINTEKSPEIVDDKNGEIIALQPNIAGIIHPNIDFGNPYDENKQKGFRINEKFFLELIKNGQLPKIENLKTEKITLILKPKETKK